MVRTDIVAHARHPPAGKLEARANAIGDFYQELSRCDQVTDFTQRPEKTDWRFVQEFITRLRR